MEIEITLFAFIVGCFFGILFWTIFDFNMWFVTLGGILFAMLVNIDDIIDAKDFGGKEHEML